MMLSCGTIVRRTEILRHPDAAMLIAEATGDARVYIYDAETNSMIEYGWIGLDGIEGWTITKFDWEAKIIERDN